MPIHFQIAMKSLAKKYKERAFRDGIWRYISVDDFILFATRHHRRNKIKDNELTFEDFFCKDLVEEWNFNFSHQSERTYNILKFLDVLHPKKDLSFSAEYDESEDDFILVNVKALS